MACSNCGQATIWGRCISRAGYTTCGEHCAACKTWRPVSYKELLRNGLTEATLPIIVDNDRTVKPLPACAYSTYIKSPSWKATRSRALKHARNRCQVCNSSRNLDVHHRTYERLGAEQMSDLTVLCRTCHGLFHRHKRMPGQ